MKYFGFFVIAVILAAVSVAALTETEATSDVTQKKTEKRGIYGGFGYGHSGYYGGIGNHYVGGFGYPNYGYGSHYSGYAPHAYQSGFYPYHGFGYH